MRTDRPRGRRGAARLHVLLALVAAVALGLVLARAAAAARWRRDVARALFDDDVERLLALRGAARVPAETAPRGREIVVSVAERRLWLRQGDSVLFSTEIAAGSGAVPAPDGRGLRPETPRGRFVVRARDSLPVWIPPDWHFAEQARRRGLGLVHLAPGEARRLPDGTTVAVDGLDVVRRDAAGRALPWPTGDGRELVVAGNLIVPPPGTRQRRYAGVLGTRRLDLGGGYAIHGTDHPEMVGQAVVHGCVRLRNEDVEWLYEHVAVGTPVTIR
jgi:hypothetical protein